MKVTVYSTTTCQYCKAEEAWLDDHKVAHDKIVVDTVGESAIRELQELSGGLSVPFTVITHDDGKQDRSLGFDPVRLSQALGLAAA